MRLPVDAGDYVYVVDRVITDNLHFFELSSRTSGDKVLWSASPVNGSALETKRLVSEGADRMAELPKQNLKLERDVKELPINTVLAEAKSDAAQCQAELSDLIRLQTSSVVM
jgi:hypothetical protein